MDRWQDKQSGANRSKLVVVVESFQFVEVVENQVAVPPSRPLRVAGGLALGSSRWG